MVKFTLQALCLSLLSCTIASPLAAPATTDIEAVETITLDKRAQNRCEYFYDGGERILFSVWMGGWGNHDGTSLSGCGIGFLDNLRGECGLEIFNWGCGEIHENPHDTMTTFRMWGRGLGGDQAPCVERAFRLASPGGRQTVSCRPI